MGNAIPGLWTLPRAISLTSLRATHVLQLHPTIAGYQMLGLSHMNHGTFAFCTPDWSFRMLSFYAPDPGFVFPTITHRTFYEPPTGVLL